MSDHPYRAPHQPAPEPARVTRTRRPHVVRPEPAAPHRGFPWLSAFLALVVSLGLVTTMEAAVDMVARTHFSKPTSSEGVTLAPGESLTQMFELSGPGRTPWVRVGSPPRLESVFEKSNTESAIAKANAIWGLRNSSSTVFAGTGAGTVTGSSSTGSATEWGVSGTLAQGAKHYLYLDGQARYEIERYEGQSTLTVRDLGGSAIAMDGMFGSHFRATVNRRQTVTSPTNITPGASYDIELTQAPNGLGAVEWGSAFQWARDIPIPKGDRRRGRAPQLPTTPGGTVHAYCLATSKDELACSSTSRQTPGGTLHSDSL